MDVAELIERLGRLDPGLPVVVMDGEYGLGFADFRLSVDRGDADKEGVWRTWQEGPREVVVIS